VLRAAGAGDEEVGAGGQQGSRHIARMPGITQERIDGFVADLGVATDPPVPDSH
jgi:hypothetical protein